MAMSKAEREKLAAERTRSRIMQLQSEPVDEGNSVDITLRELEIEEEKRLSSSEEPRIKNEDKPKSTVVKKKAEVKKDDYIITIVFLDEDDQAFFKVAGKLKGLKVTGQYLQTLIDDDIKEKAIDVKDDLHSLLISTKTKDMHDKTTTTLPVDYKNKIVIQAAKHRMKDFQYIAYLIHKARMKTPGWN